MIHIDRKDKAYFFMSPYFPENMAFTLLPNGAKAFFETATKASIAAMAAGLFWLLINFWFGVSVNFPAVLLSLGVVGLAAFAPFYHKEINRSEYWTEDDGAFGLLRKKIQKFLDDEEVAHLFTDRLGGMSDIDKDYSVRINAVLNSFLINTKGLSKHTDRRPVDELEQALNQCHKSVSDLIDKRNKAIKEEAKCRQERRRIQRNYEERRSRDFDEEN